MFLIHKHSIVQRYSSQNNSFEKILACDIKEGDILRGYDIINSKYTKFKAVSKVVIPARIIELRTTSFEKILISETTLLASTKGVWNFRCPVNAVKLFKKPSVSNVLHTPKPLGSSFGEIAAFISIAAAEPDNTILVDDFVYVTEAWNGQQIKGKSSNNLKASVVTRLSKD
jgi:hypothetical protein